MNSKPKILSFDLETAPLKSAIWSAKQRFTPYAMLEKDWYIMSFSAKWLGSDNLMYKDLRHKPPGSEDDRELVNILHSLMNEADMVIAHNGDNFDIPSLNTRFARLGFTAPSPTHSIDTYRVARRKFRLPYNSLEYCTETFLPEEFHKRKSAKFPGYKLWDEALKGNPEAWQEMEDYNRQDVIALEALYLFFRNGGYIDGHPNVSIMGGEAPNVPSCPTCGSSKVHRRGTRSTKQSGVYFRYKCSTCNSWSRSRTTITDPLNRKNILVN